MGVESEGAGGGLHGASADGRGVGGPDGAGGRDGAGGGRDDASAAERLDLFFDLSPDLMCIAGLDGRFRRLNRAWERTLGYPLEGLYAMSWTDLVHPDDQARSIAAARRGYEAGTMFLENRLRHRDGSYRWLEWSAIRAPDVPMVCAVARDVTERRLEQERLRASEAYKTAVHEASTDAIVALSEDGRVVDFNAAAERSYGYRADQVVGTPFAEVAVPVEGRAAFKADLARWGKVEGRIVAFRREHVGLRADGSRFPFELTATRLDAGLASYAAFIRDLTEVKRADEERRSLEDQLRQAQKMEAVGRLAGNVAHDFHDLLGAIAGFSDVAESVQAAGPARERLEQVKRATERAVSVVDRLLAFGRRKALSPKVLDANALIAELEHLVVGLMRDDVSLQLVLDDRAALVKADPAQLQQSLLNLVVNAREAMPVGGRLRITTANLDLEAASLPPGVDAAPGPYVRVTVEDNGIGMTREVSSRAFEPFFTTKQATGASGLGLSTVYGIVTQSGGFVRVESAPNRGTLVHLFLPAVDVGLEPSARPPAPAATVLLVEDEEAVRQLVRRILEGRGYKVLLARHGGEALELIHQTDLPIHLLLTDAVMPVLSGPELLRRAIALRPQMKLAIMSGYTDRPAVTGVPFIGKPFTPAELERRVREILDAPTPEQHPTHR
ncbi:MAG TPA: PAS domain S-box protein [Polyangia bacterium]|nr:PAS domain S-box protein [Polyangia bacterium]